MEGKGKGVGAYTYRSSLQIQSAIKFYRYSGEAAMKGWGSEKMYIYCDLYFIHSLAD